MKDPRASLFDEEEHGQTSRSSSYCWWRSAAKFEECTEMKLEFTNLSKIAPRVKILREMERLSLIASEALDDLRHKLFSYRPGDFWAPTGGVKKEEMDIPPVVSLLLAGFHNAGKSSLVNLMYSVLGRSGIIPFAQTSSGGSSFTLRLEEHNVLRSIRSGFCVYDTRGFDYDRVDEGVQELSEWLTEGVRHDQLCYAAGDDDELLQCRSGLESTRSRSKYANRTVNYVIVVANVAEIYKALKAGEKKPLDSLRRLFCSVSLLRCHDQKPIMILTHGDNLSTEDRIEARLKICEYLGISETTGVYDVVCVTEYGFVAEEFDPVSAYGMIEAVYRGLLISDRGHRPKKNWWDTVLVVWSWIMCSLSVVFAFLSYFFYNLALTHRRRDRLKN